ncbi:hypothetical protein WJX73_006910 [Symbiochloris irregularis]|uniref:Protein kinase domain-containing protein n=1 Tax=Symbiochloris irregularis TaxID=706552 RepID=A0AAW1P804_9CHLO
MGACVSQSSKQAPDSQRTQASSGNSAAASAKRSGPAPSSAGSSAAGSKYGRYGSKAYTVVKDLEASQDSHTSSLRLMRNNTTNELVAAKWVPREAGAALSRATEREIINHRRLRHPNIVCFREVYTTDSHLVIVMEYVAGGRFENMLSNQGALPEKEARRYFGQLIDAVAYCHEQGVFHRALNMGNLLVEPQPSGPAVLKVSDFAYSKNALLDSRPKTMIGDLTYTCPELLLGLRVDDGNDTGRSADVWACGVILYKMLTGLLPFRDSDKPNQLTRGAAQNIVNVQWSMPADVQVSPNCLDLLNHIFVKDPKGRLDAIAIKQHPWFTAQPESPAVKMPLPPERQTVSEIQAIIERARKRRQEMMDRQKSARSNSNSNGTTNGHHSSHRDRGTSSINSASSSRSRSGHRDSR